jgi:HD-GYP domain-containing protein (c-di-GMP phosphodiesterase class II)
VSDDIVPVPVPADGPESQSGITAEATTYSANQISRVKDLLTRLYAARRTVRFYPLDHPASEEAIGALKDALDRYHREGVDIEFVFFEGELIFGQQLLIEESVLFDQLVRELTSMGVGSLTVTRGIGVSELALAVAVLASDSRVVEQAGGIVRMLSEAGVSHVEVGSVKVFEKVDSHELTPEEAKASYDDAIELLREIDSLITRNRVPTAGRVKSVARSLVDNVLSNRYAMLELTGLRNYDEYTFFHSANVAILSLALGSSITSDYRFLSSLGVGALLHDIGKMTVDLDILNKPGPLTAEEWAFVRQHPVYGAQQAALIPGLDKSAIVIILEHHMRYDGSGYPARGVRRPQHLAARVVAVADAFDAMTSRRVYSAARVQDDAMSMLAQSAGSALDPVLTRLFISMMGLYPPRSVVRLDDGRTGIVVRPSGKDMVRPIVRIFAAADGTMIEPHTTDLSQAGQPGVSMCLDAADLNIDIDEYL